MLIPKFWGPAYALILIVEQLYCPVWAIEDITDRQVLFGVSTKFKPDKILNIDELSFLPDHQPAKLAADFGQDYENKFKSLAEDTDNEQHVFRFKPLPKIKIRTNEETKPIDNFGDVYQRINESIFHEAEFVNTEPNDSYPPLPTTAFNDDPTSITDSAIVKPTMNGAQIFEIGKELNVQDFKSGYKSNVEKQIQRITTQEPSFYRTTNTVDGKETTLLVFTQHTPSEGRFHHFQEQELLHRNPDFATTAYTPRENGSGDELVDDETVPAPPPPDWAVQMMIAPSPVDNNLETGTEEPFFVTESLKNAFSTPNSGQSPEKTTKHPSATTPVATIQTTINNEVPTMKMFEWEMQRGDIDVRGANNLNTRPIEQNTFTPTSKRRPASSPTGQPFDVNSILMPQEVPDDVDLPKTYEIGPRLVLPQSRDETRDARLNLNKVAVDLPQNPPIAPPTLVSLERDRELKKLTEGNLQRLHSPDSVQEISLHTAPKRGGSGALLVPIDAPKTVPQTLATFGNRERLPFAKDTTASVKSRPITLTRTLFPSYTPPPVTSLPSIQVSNEDYSSEVKKEENASKHLLKTLATKPPGDFNPLISLPLLVNNEADYTKSPGYEPNGPPGIVIISSPPGYFPENIVATTPSFLPKTSTPYFTETLIPKKIAVNSNDPNREYSPRVPTTTPAPQAVNQNHEDSSSSAELVNQHVSYSPFGRVPSPTAIAYDPNVKVVSASSFLTSRADWNKPSVNTLENKFSTPRALDIPSAVANQAVRNGKAAYFFIPPPVRLSMSKAIQLRPFHGVQPLIHVPRNMLKNVVPNVATSLTFLAHTTARPIHHTTPTRLLKFRNEQSFMYANPSLQMRHSNQLNWVPIGLAAPKRLGAVKLIPAHSKEERIDIQPVEDLDAKRSDQVCVVNPEDHFSDLRLETRQIARKCFKRAINCLLHEVVPLERRISYTEEQCLNFCGHHPFCRSMTFSTTMSICDIFDARNGTGMIQAVSYAGSKYYEPLSSTAIECWKASLSDKFFTKAPQISVLIDSDDRNDLVHDQEQEEDNQNTLETTSKGAPVVVAPKDRCDADKDVVVLKSVGFRLRNFGVPPLYQNSSETECVFSCLVNLARGHVPYNCASTSYGRFSGCLIYRSGLNMNGNSHLMPEASFTHYEKTCVSNQLVDLCRGYPIVRQPQHTLLGYSKQALQAQSLINCLELCFNDFAQGGNCKSVSYYYEERQNNCILNTESRQSMPQFFISEVDEVVDYASFESCLNARTDLRHKATKGQSLKHLPKKPSRLLSQHFVPHAIMPPVGSFFKSTTKVYTSTRVTKPPPQIYSDIFVAKKDSNSIKYANTNQKHVFIVDGDKIPTLKENDKQRSGLKSSGSRFLVKSEQRSRHFDDHSSEQDSMKKQFNRILQDSIHKIGLR